MFHDTIFFGKSLDEAQTLLNASKEDLDNSTIVSLLAAFEHTVFLHRRSPVHSSQARNKENLGGLNEAIKRFKHQISPRTYRDTELLCEYRHWVAHGKRWEKPSTADPANTHECLTDFLSQAELT